MDFIVILIFLLANEKINVLVNGDKAPCNIACWSFNVIGITRIL